jgi:hypothetical protein
VKLRRHAIRRDRRRLLYVSASKRLAAIQRRRASVRNAAELGPQQITQLGSTARSAASVVSSQRHTHYALWNCIHGGEGNGWDPSGTYSGPLQMTRGWAGYPISDWNTVPISEVYADAETQYRASGYSVAWLEGQWPNTSPPCLAYR